MRTINLSNDETYGTNNNDGGVFRQRKDGSWDQLRGNSQSPYFKSAPAFYKWLLRNLTHSFAQFDSKPTMTNSFGWD